MATSPPSLGKIEQRMLMVVLFPAPLRPRKANKLPCSTEKLIPSTALTAPKDFLSALTEMISGMGFLQSI